MKTYISLLRGINVSGQKLIRMAELKDMYNSFAFEDVITYIQSGNVIFKASPNFKPDTLIEKIEDGIKNKFGFDVPVILRSVKDFEQLITNNPFLNERGIDFDKIGINFLNSLPKPEAIEKLNGFDFSPDRFILKGNEIYIYCPNGFGRSKLSNNFFESKLLVKATGRNWKTVNKLLELCK